jgi:hypothetical protein
VGEEYRSLSSSIWSFLHSSVTFFYLGHNILLKPLILITLSLRFSLNVSDHVSHPYKPTGKTNIKEHTTHILSNFCIARSSTLEHYQLCTPTSHRSTEMSHISAPYLILIVKIHFNIIIPHSPRLLKGPLYSGNFTEHL